MLDRYSVTRIYIDTEFFSPTDLRLISIALVCGNDQLYLELDCDLSEVPLWTKEHVLPLLEGKPRCFDDLRSAVIEWLRPYREMPNPTIAYDSTSDIALLRYLIGPIPPWLSVSNIFKKMDRRALSEFRKRPGHRRHHALDDALANEASFNPGIGT